MRHPATPLPSALAFGKLALAASVQLGNPASRSRAVGRLATSLRTIATATPTAVRKLEGNPGKQLILTALLSWDKRAPAKTVKSAATSLANRLERKDLSPADKNLLIDACRALFDASRRTEFLGTPTPAPISTIPLPTPAPFVPRYPGQLALLKATIAGTPAAILA